MFRPFISFSTFVVLLVGYFSMTQEKIELSYVTPDGYPLPHAIEQSSWTDRTHQIMAMSDLDTPKSIIPAPSNSTKLARSAVKKSGRSLLPRKVARVKPGRSKLVAARVKNQKFWRPTL